MADPAPWQFIDNGAVEAEAAQKAADDWAAKASARMVRDDWSRNPGVTPTPASSTYTVQPGDTLSGVSAQTLGDANAWPTLARTSAVSNPDVIQPRQALNVGLAQRQLNTPPTGEDVRALRSTGGSPYVVKPGDTLSDISRRMYGDPNRWDEIASANGIDNPNLIYAGQRLAIPPMAPRPAAPAANEDVTARSILGSQGLTPESFGAPPSAGGWRDIANAQLGKPYIWGSAGGRSDFSQNAAGFDCSGFVSYVMQNGLGIKLPAQTASAYTATQPISAKDAKPGDVVLYNMGQNDPHVQHIAIYLGNGQVIQAGGTRRDVNIGPISGAGTYEFRRPVGSPNATQTQTQVANVMNSAAPDSARSDSLEHSDTDDAANWIPNLTPTSPVTTSLSGPVRPAVNQPAAQDSSAFATVGQKAQDIGQAVQDLNDQARQIPGVSGLEDRLRSVTPGGVDGVIS